MDAVALAPELDALEQAIEAVRAGGDDPRALRHAAPRLYERAHEARDAGHAGEVDRRLIAAYESSSGPARRAFGMAQLAENDREFRRAAVDGLDVRRVDLHDAATAIPALELELIATPAGALIPRTTSPGERVLATIGAEIQLLADNDLPEPQAIELHERGFDPTHLHGQLELLYGLRASRRLAWGIGFCALTDRRAFGVIFDTDVEGVAQTPEAAAMPVAAIEGDGWGSVIVFSARRELFEDHEIIAPLIGRSRPYVNLIGSCALALHTFQVVDRADLVVRPGKGEIADGIARFVSGEPAAPAVPRPAATSKPVTAAPGRRRTLIAVGAAAALAAGVLLGVALAGGDDEPASSQAAPTLESAAAAAEGEEVGEPVVEPAPDGLVTAAEGSQAAAPVETVDPTIPVTVTHGDLEFELPAGAPWTVGDERTANEGRRRIRELHGPDGELIMVIHTPDFEAEPDPAYVQGERNMPEANAVDARLVVLENFPTDECRDRRCDDYVLNDESFGGVAVLASDSGGTASEVARSVAASVRAAGE